MHPVEVQEPVIDQLAEVWASIVAACDRLPPEAWGLSTDCPGWTVRDHLAHLIGIERMLLGHPVPPAPAVVPAYVNNEIGSVNEAWISLYRDRPGAEVLAEFSETVASRLAALRSYGTAEFDEVGWSPIGEAPYREFMAVRVVDCWAHEQDIRLAVDRPGGRGGAGELLSLDRCDKAMPFVVGKKAAAPDGASVVFDVSGPEARRFAVVMSGGRGRMAFGVPDTSTVELHMDQATYWRLGFGRVAPAEVLAAEGVTFDGDTGLGRAVVSSMSFMI